jgi:deoxyribonuclease V
MRPHISHGWDVPVEQAKAIQHRLASQVILTWDERPVRMVAGVDVGFPGGRGRAAAAVVSFPDLQLVDSARAETKVSFPYIPGLLAFREGPVILAALEHLSVEPDLLIFDGQGLAHPRRMGIATHMGVLLDVPSIGCAKSRLVGIHQEPGPSRGAHVRLYHEAEVIGAVLRTRDGVNPVYVSIGHRVDLERAIDFVLHCCTRYRLPEPLRWAHQLASGERRPQGQQLSLF